MGRNTRKQVAEEVIGLGALAQLSRNRKINGLGEIGIIAGLIILVGELVKFIFKWLFVKPLMFCMKIMWKASKYIFIYSTALFMTFSQFAYKEIKELNIKRKERNNL